MNQSKSSAFRANKQINVAGFHKNNQSRPVTKSDLARDYPGESSQATHGLGMLMSSLKRNGKITQQSVEKVLRNLTESKLSYEINIKDNN